MQIIEIRPESDRFLRLLEVLGEWYEKGKIIIFVQVSDSHTITSRLHLITCSATM
jgi:hypothetical protein